MTNPKGRFGIHGGQYIPETLMNAVQKLETAYEHYKNDPAFQAELTRLLNEFLGAQDYNTRVIFMRRFWFGDSTKEIAKRLHAGESMVKSRLSRTLKRLREYLRKEGYDI